MSLARPLRLALLPAGLALGLAAEWEALRRGPLDAAATTAELRLAAADLVVGLVLIGCGVVAWSKRPSSGVGVLLVAAGFAWFLGTFGAGLGVVADVGGLFVTLHRGPLVHAVLSYPKGRPTGRLSRAVVAFAYLEAILVWLGQNRVAAALAAGHEAAQVALVPEADSFEDATHGRICPPLWLPGGARRTTWISSRTPSRFARLPASVSRSNTTTSSSGADRARGGRSWSR